MKIALILRKKIDGENSMEEIAFSLANQLKDNVQLYQLPYDSYRLISVIKNILYVKKIKADVFHVFSITEGYLVPFLRNCLLTCHDVNTVKYLKKKWKQKLYLLINVKIPVFFAKKITCVSTQTKTEYECVAPYSQKKLIVISNPLNKLIKTNIKVFNEECPNILHIGTAYRKNLINVIKALDGIVCKLIIVGKLKDDQYQLLLEKKINYINEYDIPFEKVIEYYNEADIVSFPSSYEGFGMPLIEANKVGRPVLGSKLQVFSDVSPNAYYVADQDNPDSIRDGFLEIINNNQFRNDLIEHGIENTKKYSLESIANEYMNLYKDILK